jgi:hypothetical protein
MGSRHGRKVTFSPPPDALDLSYRPLKSNGDVIEFLEETMNRIRQGPVDLRTANVIGRLAGILLNAIDQRTARTSAEANASLKSQLYAKRLCTFLVTHLLRLPTTGLLESQRDFTFPVCELIGTCSNSRYAAKGWHSA